MSEKIERAIPKREADKVTNKYAGNKNGIKNNKRKILQGTCSSNDSSSEDDSSISKESSDSDTSGSSSSEEETQKSNVTENEAKKTSVEASNNFSDSSDSFSEDSETESGNQEVISEDNNSSSNDSSDSSDGESENELVKNKKVKDNSSSSSESEDESNENENKKIKVNGTNGINKYTLHDTNTSDSSSSEEEVSDEDSKIQNITSNREQGSSDSSSSSDSESDSEEEEDADMFIENSNQDGNSKSNNSISESNSSKRKLYDSNSNSPKKTKVDENSSKCNIVYVGGLSFNVDPEWLRQEFEEAGDIDDVRIIYNKDTGMSKGFAYVEFTTAEGANNAMKFAGKEIDGRAIKVDFADQKSGSINKKSNFSRDLSETSNTIYMGNLSFNATEDEIWETFGNCGQIVSVRIPTHQDSGKLKGFGYVEFADTNAAQKAMKLHGTEICGRAIRLDFTTPRKNNSNFGSRGGRGGKSHDNRGGRGGRGGRGSRGGFGRGGFNTTAAANRGVIVPF